MYQSEYDAIVAFTQNLSTMRDTVNDQQLLDSCQKYLTDLLAYSSSLTPDPDPAPEQAST
jgi:hypothetical protein